jgi:HK97 family phage prohead protease
MKSGNMEIRKIQSNFKTGEDRTVEGYAVVFESPSVDLGWTEIIHRGAITEDTIKESDVLAKFNHDDSKVLARSKKGEGSLLLEVDESGVRYMFDAPKTALGDELLEYLHRGDIDSSSFCFTIDNEDPNAERWYKEDGVIYRDIYKINRLYDVSPVFSPAYEATSCSARFADVKAKSEEIDKKMDLLLKEIEEL